jgi:hypothetical protein
LGRLSQFGNQLAYVIECYMIAYKRIRRAGEESFQLLDLGVFLFKPIGFVLDIH